MVDGGGTNGLVEAGFCHPAHTSAAVDADVRAARQQFHCGDHRQAGGHIHVVAAVLFNGAFGPSVGAAAEQGCYLHHDALWRAQGHRLRRMAGEQQPGRARCPQRRTGAGGIAAAQQLLSAADVVLERGLLRFCLPEQGRVLRFAQRVEGTDVVRGKGGIRGQHAGNMVREHAHHCVRDLLCHVQLMQAHDDRKALFMGQLLQDGQQLDLALDVQKGGGLVQQQHFRLLADGTGQQNTLTLAVTDAVEVPVREMRSSGNFQCILHGLPVGVGQNAQPPGVRDAPGGGKLKAGGQLGAAGVRQHQGQLLRPGRAGVGGQVLPVQQHSAAQRGQLSGQCFEQGGFARTVGADKDKDLPRICP